MATEYLFVLPFVVFVTFSLTIITTYTIALGKNQILPFFHYVSDTGTFPPESCIFSLMLNVIALLFIGVVYIRDKLIYLISDSSNVKTINNIATYFGYLACLGLSLIANFQVSNVLMVHLIGCHLAFGFGCVYASFQSVISIKVYPKVGNRNLNYFRIILAVLMIINYVLCFGLGIIAHRQFKGKNFRKWEPEDGGYIYHVVSVICEWILIVIVELFLLTFSHEFRLVTIEKPQVYFKEANN